MFGSDVSVNFVAIELANPIATNANVKKVAEREIGLARD
jgi:hypothetical protein